MKVIRQVPFDCVAVDLPKITRYNALNPSFIVQGDTLRAIYRGCNYNLRKSGYQKFYGSVAVPISDTQNYIAELTTSLALKWVDFLEDRHVRARVEALDGIQDLKLFAWKHRLFAVGSGCNSETFFRKTTKTRVFRMMLFEIKRRRLNWIATLPSQESQEKNWMPLVRDGELFLLYRPNPFRLLKYDVQLKSTTESGSATYSAIDTDSSGGSCFIPFGTQYLGLIHKKHGIREAAQYSHRLIVVSDSLEITRVSEPFTFENERIEYGSGLAINGPDIYFGYGVYDERATILRTDLQQLLNWLDWQHSYAAHS